MTRLPGDAGALIDVGRALVQRGAAFPFVADDGPIAVDPDGVPEPAASAGSRRDARRFRPRAGAAAEEVRGLQATDQDVVAVYRHCLTEPVGPDHARCELRLFDPAGPGASEHVGVAVAVWPGVRRADDEAVAVERHGRAEVVEAAQVAGLQLRLLDPGSAVPDEHVDATRHSQIVLGADDERVAMARHRAAELFERLRHRRLDDGLSHATVSAPGWRETGRAAQSATKRRVVAAGYTPAMWTIVLLVSSMAISSAGQVNRRRLGLVTRRRCGR